MTRRLNVCVHVAFGKYFNLSGFKSIKCKVTYKIETIIVILLTVVGSSSRSYYFGSLNCAFFLNLDFSMVSVGSGPFVTSGNGCWSLIWPLFIRIRRTCCPVWWRIVVVVPAEPLFFFDELGPWCYQLVEDFVYGNGPFIGKIQYLHVFLIITVSVFLFLLYFFWFNFKSFSCDS